LLKFNYAERREELINFARRTKDIQPFMKVVLDWIANDAYNEV